MNINEFTDEDLIQDEILVEDFPVEEIPIEETPIEPEGPEGSLDPKVQVYVPKATTYRPGIASYDSKDFLVDPKGKVSLIVDLNAVKENSDTALETANDAKSIAEDALEQVIIGEGTKIYEDGVLQASINVDKDIQEQFNDIDELIPSQASSENQLADKEFVNSSIATNTANFIGTFANVPALLAYTETITNNDYAFVVNSERDFASTTEMNAYDKSLLTNFDYAWISNGSNYDLYRFDIIEQTWGLKVTDTAKADVTLNTAYNRYKAVVSGNNLIWLYEYTLNNSSFTADQWAAINSGITASGVTQIADIQNKMNKVNPEGSGTFTLNRKADTVIGSYSFAEGSETEASGNWGSHAEGRLTTASGNLGSHAEGYSTIASGDCSHAEGSDAEASAIASHAEGSETEASGNYSHAEGRLTESENIASHAEGNLTTASGVSSHAEGNGTLASAIASHAEGNGTEASGVSSHAEGYTTKTSAIASHAEGQDTVAGGNYSHAEGYKTETSAIASHAEGNKTEASGYGSHAEGSNTVANRYGQHVFGAFNIIDTQGADGDARGKYVEIVGNGTINERSNARTLDWDGNEHLAGNLQVDNRIENNYLDYQLDQTITANNQNVFINVDFTKYDYKIEGYGDWGSEHTTHYVFIKPASNNTILTTWGARCNSIRSKSTKPTDGDDTQSLAVDIILFDNNSGIYIGDFVPSRNNIFEVELKTYPGADRNIYYKGCCYSPYVGNCWQFENKGQIFYSSSLPANQFPSQLCFIEHHNMTNITGKFRVWKRFKLGQHL